MLDAGLVTIKILTEHLKFQEVEACSLRLNTALKNSEKGSVLSVGEVTYEPFTSDMPEHGKKWNEIRLTLVEDVRIDVFNRLLLESGIPEGSHFTYLDQGRLYGESV